MRKLIKKIRLIPAIYDNLMSLKYSVNEGLDYYIMSALNEVKSGVIKEKRKQELTVSLTTFGARIYDVHVVVESLMLQTVKADKIILWLSRDEFSPDGIPEILKMQEKRGLTICYCKDIKSYKKLVPAIADYPDDLIITADDDVVYPIDHIERLYKAYLKEPEIIHCCRAHLIKYNSDGNMLPYTKWDKETECSKASYSIFPTGCGGVLYYPGCFDADVLCEKVFMRYCPFADDIWFKYMSYRNRVKCRVIPNHMKWKYYKKNDSRQTISLWSINKANNDKQFKNLLHYYNDSIRSL